jgi:hypothetical protein
VERVLWIEPAVEEARFALWVCTGLPPFWGPKIDLDRDGMSVFRLGIVELPGSSRGKFCTGAEMRRDAKDGIELDILLAVVDGIGTGVAFGERTGAVGFEPVRIVLRSLKSEALDNVRGFLLDVVEAIELRVVDCERRVDVSDGVELSLDSMSTGTREKKKRWSSSLGPMSRKARKNRRKGLKITSSEPN